MKKRSLLPAVLCLTLLFGLLSNLLAGEASAKESRAAIVASVEGTVMIMKSGGSAEYRAFEDMSLNQGDHIRTEDGSSIVLKVVDQDDEVTIGPNTELYISSLFESGEGGKKSKLKVWAGSLWFKVKKLVNADDEFAVETPTAVMSVRGSNGYIETKYGQLFALMASGILETNATNGSGSGSANVYPGQQINVLPGQPQGNSSDNITPMDIGTFVSGASPEIIKALLETIQQIREENEQFIRDVADGKKEIDPQTGLKLDSPDVQQQFGDNLTNLLANVAKEAIQSNKLSQAEVQSLIEKANATITGERIDLNNVKPFDTSIGLDPSVKQAKQEQMKKLLEQREQQRKQEIQSQQDKAKQLSELLDRLSAERKKQEEANKAAKEQEQKKASETYLNSLSASERERYLQDQQRLQQPNSPGTSGGGSSPTSGGNSGGAPGGGGGSDDDGNSGGGVTPPDTTPPELTVVYPSTDLYTVNTITQEITVYAEQGAAVKLFQGEAATPLATKNGLGATTLVTFVVSLTEGLNTFKLTATDAAGNVTAKSVKFVLNTSAPSLVIKQPANETNYVRSKEQKIEAEIAQGITVSLYKGDSAEPLASKQGTGTENIVFALYDYLSEGTNAFKVTARDALGNTASQSVTFILDTVPPSLQINSPVNDTTYVSSSQQTIELQAEEGATVKLYAGTMNGTPLQTAVGKGATPITLTVNQLAEGMNTFIVSATDAAGNTSAKTLWLVLVTSGPLLTIVHPFDADEPNKTFYVNSPQQSIRAQTSAGVQVRLYKGSDFSPIDTLTGTANGPVEFTSLGLVEGLNPFRVTATDVIGNVSERTVVYVLDTAAPELRVMEPIGSPYPVSTPAQTIKVQAEEGAVVRLYKDSLSALLQKQTSPSATATLEFPVNDLAEGTNTYLVTATDKAGNVTTVTVIYKLASVSPSQKKAALSLIQDGQPVNTTETLQLQGNEMFKLGLVLTDFANEADRFYAAEAHLELGNGIRWYEGYEDNVGVQPGTFIFDRSVSESVLGSQLIQSEAGIGSELTYVITQYATSDPVSDPGNIAPFPGSKTLVLIPLMAQKNFEVFVTEGTIRLKSITLVNKAGNRIEVFPNLEPIRYEIRSGGV
ncbi:FecR domain-containing protein [Paenibacillus hodogayensis]|uniref:FecR domain-containing protein n=1 Tax=Paenibacillus hodogayensis TaxID=279208 RepID=A0ABV5VXF0_9BACL